MTRDTKPGTSLQSGSLDLEPALDGEILLPGQQLSGGRRSPQALRPRLDYRRQAREEYLKADSERAFGDYIDARRRSSKETAKPRPDSHGLGPCEGQARARPA